MSRHARVLHLIYGSLQGLLPPKALMLDMDRRGEIPAEVRACWVRRGLPEVLPACLRHRDAGVYDAGEGEEENTPTLEPLIVAGGGAR